MLFQYCCYVDNLIIQVLPMSSSLVILTSVIVWLISITATLNYVLMPVYMNLHSCQIPCVYTLVLKVHTFNNHILKIPKVSYKPAHIILCIPVQLIRTHSLPHPNTNISWLHSYGYFSYILQPSRIAKAFFICFETVVDIYYDLLLFFILSCCIFKWFLEVVIACLDLFLALRCLLLLVLCI